MGESMSAVSISILGFAIVFITLAFLAVYVSVVSKIVHYLESTILKKEEAPKANAAAAVVKDNKEAMKVAVITAAISEERKEPVDRFVITNIQKL